MNTKKRFISGFLSLLMVLTVIIGVVPPIEVRAAALEAVTEDVSNITENSVTLNGSLVANGGYSIVEYGFQYGINGGKTEYKVILGTLEKGKVVPFPLEDLSPGDGGWYLFYVKNANGEEAKGKIKYWNIEEKEESFEVSEDYIEFSADGGSDTFEITAESAWTISESLNWITVSPTKGSSDKTITVTCTANGSTSSREGEITVKHTASGKIHDIEIYQDGTTSELIPELRLDTPKLNNPDISSTSSGNGYYSGQYSGKIPCNEDVELEWDDVGADYYALNMIVLSGSPNPASSSESRVHEIKLNYHTSETNYTIDSSHLEDYAGKWVKVSIQPMLDNGDYGYRGLYYFELGEDEQSEVSSGVNLVSASATTVNTATNIKFTVKTNKGAKYGVALFAGEIYLGEDTTKTANGDYNLYSYTHQFMSPGTKTIYAYPYDADGNIDKSKGRSCEITIQAPNGKLNAPVISTTDAQIEEGASFKLTWSKPKDAPNGTKFNVYLHKSGAADKAIKTALTTTTYTVPSTEFDGGNGATYVLYVIAYASGYEQSADSNGVNVTVCRPESGGVASVKEVSTDDTIAVGEKLQLTVTTDIAASGVSLCVKENGNIYWIGDSTSEKTSSSSEKTFIVEYAFNSTGLLENGVYVTNVRRVYAYPIDAQGNVIENDTVADYVDIEVTPAQYSIGAFTAYGIEVELGNSATIRWDAAKLQTNDTVYYNVYLSSNKTTILLTPDKITSNSITVDSSILKELGVGSYGVMVIATAAKHSQKQTNATITVLPKTQVKETVKPLINPIRCSAEPIVEGLSVTFTTAASDETALDRVEMYVDGKLVKKVSSTNTYANISYTTDTLVVGDHTVLVKAYDTSANYNSWTQVFTVEKLSSGIIYDVQLSDYEFFAGSYITFVVKTSKDTTKIRLVDGEYTFSEQDTGYTDSDEYRTWTFDQYVGTVGSSRKLRVESYSNGWTGNYYTTDPFTVQKNSEDLGAFKILNPKSGTTHIRNQDLTITWSEPAITPDWYVVNVTGVPSGSEMIDINGNSAVISGQAFEENGTYAISVTAQKSGYNQTEAHVNVTISCTHEERVKIGTKYSSEMYYNDTKHSVTAVPNYSCDICGCTFVVNDEATTEYIDHDHDVELDNDGWLCDCGYVDSGSYTPWTGYLQSKSNEKAYSRVLSDGTLTNWDNVSKVFPTDTITVLGTKYNAFLIRYNVNSRTIGNTKTRFVDRTLIDRDPYTGRSIVYVSVDGVDLRCVKEGNGVLYASAYDFATVLNGSASFVANNRLHCRMCVYDSVSGMNYYWAIDLRNFTPASNWLNLDAYTDESLTTLAKADFAGAYVYGQDINISIDGALKLLNYEKIGENAYEKKGIDSDLIKTAQSIRNTDGQFNRVYKLMTNGMLFGEYTTYAYSIFKGDLSGLGNAVVDNTFLANADAISSLKQTLVMRRTEEHDKSASDHLENIMNMLNNIFTVLHNIGKSTDAYIGTIDELIKFDLQSEIDKLKAINSRTPEEDSALSTLLGYKAEWASNVDIFTKKLKLVNFAFETVDFSGKVLSQMYTAYVLVQNYEDNVKYLNSLIDNATDEYTRQVYSVVLNTLSDSYSNPEGNGVLNKYFSDKENVGILVDYLGDVIKYAKDANGWKGVTDIAKNAIKGGKGGVAANPLLLIHTVVAYAADNMFKGQDIYDAAANLYLAGDAMPLMVADLDNAIRTYRSSPSLDNHEVLKLSAIFLAQYRIKALEYCKKYQESLVIDAFLFNDQYKIDIDRIDDEIEVLNDLMSNLTK